MTTPHLQHFFPFFFFNDTATTEIYTLSLHDALPILLKTGGAYLPLDPEYPSERIAFMIEDAQAQVILTQSRLDRKSTRLNSSHSQISYAVFCLKKKKKLDHPLHDTYS